MRREMDDEAPELDLTPFVTSTRRVLDDVARAQDQGAEPVPGPAAVGTSRLAWLVAAAIVLVAGSVLALATADSVQVGVDATPSQAVRSTAVGGPSLAGPGRESSGRSSFEAQVHPAPVVGGSEADRGLDRTATVQPSALGSGALEVPTGARDPVEAGLDEPGSTSDPATDVAAPDLPPHDPARRSARKGTADPPADPASSASTLAELDAEAQRQWRSGNTKRAEALFLEIVERGGRSRYAELAFGDLFILAHQAGDARLEERRWRQYLARFPRGRFADEVRAGQCRRSAHDQARRCWQRYLADWPKGAHREEASRSPSPTATEDR